MSDPLTAKDVFAAVAGGMVIAYAVYSLAVLSWHDFFFYGRDEWWKDKLRRLHIIRR
ncbi:hypothetical protein ABNQ39_20480 [Azospirillum sp. A26]|uniref:hypothetical protein n=1 Tax=Azospirillum sp. A26 TaxID=3160607 RepID=UPI00366F862D